MLLNFVFFLTDPDPDPNYIHYIWKSEPQKKIHFLVPFFLIRPNPVNATNYIWKSEP